MFDFSAYCRICATQSKDLQSLFNYDVKSNKTLIEMIKVCAGISFDEFELRPKSICINCMEKLSSAYDFYNLIQNSEEKFNHLISTQISIKSEADAIHNVKDECNELNISIVSDLESPIDNLEQFDGVKTENIFIEESSVNSFYNEDNQITNETKNVKKFRKNPVKSKQVKKPSLKNQIQKIDNNKKDLKFECYKCKLNLSTIYKVKYHLNDHDATKCCRICAQAFTEHDYIQHSCSGLDMKCQYCPELFKTTKTLVKHINSIHKNHPNYKCYECSKAFHTKNLLEIHRPTHNTEELRFSCDICGSQYRTRFEIKEHMETVHTDKRSNFKI